MASNRQKKLTLSIALILLCLSAVGASLTIIRLYQTENWIRHTYTVEVALGDLEATLTAAGRSRVAYVNSGTPDSLEAFKEATTKVPPALARIRQLTIDNQAEQVMCDKLDANANRRLATSFESVRLKQENQTDPIKEVSLTVEVAEAAGETAIIAQQMRTSEDHLLAQRTNQSKLLFAITVCMLIASFLISVVMFWIHNRLLDRELV
jgi:CHASE3 domain sensor protein